jgi:hypothetical protein
MVWQIGKVFIAATIISFSSWLAGRQPRLAGFILALPLSTLLALAFTQTEFNDAVKSVQFAKSIFLAVPLSLLFFVPFFLADKLKWPFWGLYGTGILLLAAGYFLHAHWAR